MQDFRLARLAFAVLAVAGLGTAGVIKLARGSDHQDTPDVELNPAADMTDVYAFPGASPGRTVLVLNSWAFITPAQTGNTYFDPNLLYQFKIDNNTDGVEDKVIQITFNGSGADQTVEVRGPVAPPVPGAMGNLVAQMAHLAALVAEERLQEPRDHLGVVRRRKPGRSGHAAAPQ